MVCMKILIWGTRQAVTMDGGFSYVSSIIQIKRRRLFSTIILKKKENSQVYADR